MKLNRVEIENFRSIGNAKISFEPQCRVLVGKNEVGKSNILKALSMLDSTITTTLDESDLREGLPSEELIESGGVFFVFTLDLKDVNEIMASQAKKILSSTIDNFFLSFGEQGNINLNQYIAREFKEAISLVDIPSGERYETVWKTTYNYEIGVNWKKPKDNTLQTIYIDEVAVPLSNFELVDIDEYPDIPLDHLEDVTQEYIRDCVGSKVASFVNDNIPDTLFWYYDDKYLLPSNIEINTFKSNPDHCLALKSMFELAGISDIAEAINQATSKSKHGVRNLLARVATRTTKHFKAVWNEYKNVEFVLSPNGTFIDAGIKDTFNSYELSQRSDGFKRFVSFLLFISAKVESNNMKNTLLLFDEPDLALHPSGQKYLRDEMFKISKNNYIVYSTHSIFMIDKENISRHLIVEKKNEQTSVTQVDESNFVDEEVLFNALGYSVFETLNNSNIIFEGWKDKKIFTLALTRVSEKYKEIKKLKQTGICHARGVKDIKHIANILELAGRSYVILSDNDNPAREKQEEFVELRKSGSWKRYDELVDGVNVSTVEDFIKPRCFVKAIDKLSGENPFLPLTNEDSFNKSSKTILSFLDEELSTVLKEKNERKKMIETIKNEVFDNLTQSDIEESYYLMLSNLNKLIDKNHQAVLSNREEQPLIS